MTSAGDEQGSRRRPKAAGSNVTAPRRESWPLAASIWIAAASCAAFALGALASGGSVALCVVSAVGACVFAIWRVQLETAHPLRTAAAVLDAMRHGDYTHRAREDVVSGPVSALLREVNQLAGHLQAERCRAEEASALLQVLVERIEVALLAFDEEGALRWWNPAAEQLFHHKLRFGALARELGADELLSGPTERSVTLPGSIMPASWELRRGAFHRAGRRYQFLLLSSAQRVRREEERAAWQRLVRVLGHEVNNTLAPIQSLAATCRGLLADDAARSVPQVLAALEVMEQRSASLARFISEFARLARLPQPRLEPLELGAVVRRVVALDARCPVRVSGHPTLEILADGPLLEQALLNLVRNAIDASLAQGGRDGKGGEVTVSYHAEPQAAVISIIDEGLGVANPDNLFVPLFSTKPQGSGIGLVLARNIVEAHGGQLRLDNRVSASGCIARVTLPRGPRPSPSESSTAELEVGAAGRELSDPPARARG